MTTKPQLKPLRAAASLILTRGNQPDKIYKYLTIVRKPHISFANSLVFPGGACQPLDYKYIHGQKLQIYAKITAIRETVQQTGLLVLPPSVTFTKIEQFRTQYKKRQYDDITEYTAQIWADHLELIKPILRLATPQIPNMSRFDCIFYIVDESVQKINIGQKDDLDNLDISIDESNHFYWKEPQQYLEMHEGGKVKLPPPQLILFNILKNIQTSKLTINSIFNDKSLTVEPMMFQLNASLAIVIHGDAQYKLGQVLKKEPESRSGEKIKEYLKKRSQQFGKNSRRRIISKGQSKVIFESTADQAEPTLLKYLIQPSPTL